MIAPRGPRGVEPPHDRNPRIGCPHGGPRRSPENKHRRAAEAFLDFALSKEVHTNFVTKGITYAPCSSLVELTAEQSDMLGASPQLREKVIFVDPNYQTKNRDLWNSLMNELMAGQ